jgi:hypothetical protein
MQVHRIEPYDFVGRRQQRRAVVNRLSSLTVLMLLALRPGDGHLRTRADFRVCLTGQTLPDATTLSKGEEGHHTIPLCHTKLGIIVQ